MIMAGLILRTARLSQELQLKDLIQKEITMKHEVQQRRVDPDCCQAGRAVEQLDAENNWTIRSWWGFFVVCLWFWVWGWGLFGVLVLFFFLRGRGGEKKAYPDNSWKVPDEAAAGLLLGCKYQATNYFQLPVTVIVNGIN